MKPKSKALKTNLNLSTPILNDEISFCLRCGVKVYPISKNGKWFIEVNNNSKITTYPKEVDKNEICYYVGQTWIFWYKKLKSVSNGK